jgi:hypothetical protein
VAVKHLFGRTIIFRYIPAADGEEHIAYSLVAARIYRTIPSSAQLAASDGSEIQQVTSWTLVNEEGTGPAEYKITFNPIADPSPGSGVPYELYYVALSYKTQAGSDVIYDWEQCPIYREDGFTGKIRVSAQSVYDLDSSIEAMAENDLWTEAKIDAAIEDIVATVKAWGYKKRHVFNWEELSAAARRLSASYCARALISTGGESWITKMNDYRQEAQKLLDVAKIGYDAAGVDDPDPDSTVTTGAVAFLR